MPKQLSGQTYMEWDNMDALKADIQTLDTASLGKLRWAAQTADGNGGESVATDLLGVRNDRTGRVVAAVGPGYQVVQMPDLADTAIRAFESQGRPLVRATYSASDARAELVLMGQHGGFRGMGAKDDKSEHVVGFVVKNSFDGSTHVEVGVAVERQVCSNGMRGVVQDLTRFKHNKAGVFNLNDALLAWAESANRQVVDFSDKLTVAREKPADALAVGNILRERFGARTGDAILKLVPRYVAGDRDGKKSDPFATENVTAWSLYQAATDYFSHMEGDSASFLVRERGLLAANGLLERDGLTLKVPVVVAPVAV